MEQNCRNCGAPPTKKQNKCEYCDTITHSNNSLEYFHQGKKYTMIKTSYKKPSTK